MSLNELENRIKRLETFRPGQIRPCAEWTDAELISEVHRVLTITGEEFIDTPQGPVLFKDAPEAEQNKTLLKLARERLASEEGR
jgi:hypothetical protein